MQVNQDTFPNKYSWHCFIANSLRYFCLLVATLPFFCMPLAVAHANGSSPNVAVTIRPIHSLAASIMAGVGEPFLIIDQTHSAHDAALRPSQMQFIQDADLVVWVGPGVEYSLARSLNRIADASNVLTLANNNKISWLMMDENHHHDHDDHDDHDEHDEHD